MKPGTQTPWGPAETVTPIADGISFVSTASHGGYHVEPHARVGQLAQHRAWYEEDCEWAILCQARPDLFPREAWDAARRILAARREVRR